MSNIKTNWTSIDVSAYRLIALEKALKLERLGMKRRGQSAYSLAKQHYGLKGSREKVYSQLLDLKNKMLTGA